MNNSIVHKVRSTYHLALHRALEGKERCMCHPFKKMNSSKDKLEPYIHSEKIWNFLILSFREHETYLNKNGKAKIL